MNDVVIHSTRSKTLNVVIISFFLNFCFFMLVALPPELPQNITKGIFSLMGLNLIVLILSGLTFLTIRNK